MTQRLSGILVIALAIAGCGGDDTGVKDSGDGTEDTGGGGGGTTWRAAGEGTAYFLDGSEDNSLFHLELTRAPEPREGEAYHGFVTRNGEDPLPLGEISVAGEDVYFEGDIGTNAITGGYDTFQAWHNATGTFGEGDLVWEGQVDPVIYGVIQSLLISSPDTPSGEGSLRAVESLLQLLQDEAQRIIAEETQLALIHSQAEGIANAITPSPNDWDDDNQESQFVEDLAIGLYNDDETDDYADVILADLAEASAQVEAGHPVKDLANYAYDNIQAMVDRAEEAGISAGSAAVLGSEDLCYEKLGEVVTALGYALDGQDLDEDGTVECLVDNPTYTEGTIECALQYVSQMAQMDVSSP